MNANNSNEKKPLCKRVPCRERSAAGVFTKKIAARKVKDFRPICGRNFPAQGNSRSCGGFTGSKAIRQRVVCDRWGKRGVVRKSAKKRSTQHLLVGQKNSRGDGPAYGKSVVYCSAHKGRYEPKCGERGESNRHAGHYDAKWWSGQLFEGCRGWIFCRVRESGWINSKDWEGVGMFCQRQRVG